MRISCQFRREVAVEPSHSSLSTAPRSFRRRSTPFCANSCTLTGLPPPYCRRQTPKAEEAAQTGLRHDSFALLAIGASKGIEPQKSTS